MNATLRARADELGVQVDYYDVDGQLHHAPEPTLELVVEELEADLKRAKAVRRSTPPIHIVRDHEPVRVTATVSDATIDIEGTPVSLVVRHGDEHDAIELPADLPFGCHVVEFTSTTGPGETVVVAAPAAMPRDERFAGQGCLFAPTYALWERDQPLPSFQHLHELARTAKAGGIAVVATLPLYATFLDDPYDPSPYSPISRLHWNEVFIDDAVLPAAPLPTPGDEVDWAALAARRRHQLIEAATVLDAARLDELTAFATSHPDVGAYARYRAAARRSRRRDRRTVPSPRPVPRRPRARRDP